MVLYCVENYQAKIIFSNVNMLSLSVVYYILKFGKGSGFPEN